jgi:arsenate reductase
MIQVLHNPRCGKSRNCLAFLTSTSKKYEIIDYLQQPLSIKEIKSLIQKLQVSPLALVRQKESIWIENYKGKTLTDEDIVDALSKNPILIERPIVIYEDRALIARDLEKLECFL